MSQNDQTLALHAGHNTTKQRELEQSQYIKQHHMYLMILTMQQNYFHLLNLGIFIQDLIILQQMSLNKG